MKLKTLLLIALVLATNIAQARSVQHRANKQLHEPSTILFDVDTQKSISAHNATGIISIASMTKMITVLTVLDAQQDLTEIITVSGREPSPRIRSGMRLARRDVLELSLVSSDNFAARTLIENYPGGYQVGIKSMNAFVQRIGATSTTLVEPTGLLAANTSTAEDMVKVAQAAAKHSLFGVFANQPHAQVWAEVNKSKHRSRRITGNSTNPFVQTPVNFEMLAVKTGFTTAAGWCITMLVSYHNHRYVLVTTGNPTKQARKMQADKLIQQITNQRSPVEIADIQRVTPRNI